MFSAHQDKNKEKPSAKDSKAAVRDTQEQSISYASIMKAMKEQQPAFAASNSSGTGLGNIDIAGLLAKASQPTAIPRTFNPPKDDFSLSSAGFNSGFNSSSVVQTYYGDTQKEESEAPDAIVRAWTPSV